MNQVDKSLEQLISDIMGSQEYRNYQLAKEKIHKEPELAQTVNEFRRRNFGLQKNKDNPNLFDDYRILEEEVMTLRKNPIVDEYLEAELAICRMVQKVNWKLMEAIDFELGFWNQ